MFQIERSNWPLGGQRSGMDGLRLLRVLDRLPIEGAAGSRRKASSFDLVYPNPSPDSHQGLHPLMVVVG